MNIEQTKCDHCEKVHDTPRRPMIFDSKNELLRVPLMVNGRRSYLDFCNEKCLFDHLKQRAFFASCKSETK